MSGMLTIPWLLVGLGECGPFATVTIVPSAARIFVEATSTFEEGRAKRRERKQADRLRRRNRKVSS